MPGHAAPLRRPNPTAPRRPPSKKSCAAPYEASAAASPTQSPSERKVNKLCLSKALTIPEGTKVSEGSRRMAVRRVDVVLLTDGKGLLPGIVTDKDVSVRVIAEGMRLDQSVVSMTRNSVFVMVGTLAMEDVVVSLLLAARFACGRRRNQLVGVR